MKTLVTSLLITHVTAGTVALILGLVAMFAKKGGRLHNRVGRVYIWCMTYVALSAVLLFIVQPFTLSRLFLSGIAVFSFYLSTTGYRGAKQRKVGFTQFDHWLTYSTLVVSSGMILCGIYLTWQAISVLSILFSFFGCLTMVFAMQDFFQFGKPVEKMHWFFQHLTRMSGSYIAALTAFLVNTNLRVPHGAPAWFSLIPWIAPSVIGGMLIGRTVRYYKIKFAGKKQMVLV